MLKAVWTRYVDVPPSDPPALVAAGFHWLTGEVLDSTDSSLAGHPGSLEACRTVHCFIVPQRGLENFL